MNVCTIPLVPLLAILGLIISVAITQFIAKRLGGIGTYGALTYAFASYQAPIGLVSSVLALSPLGLCLALPLGIYSLVLHMMAVKGVNQFSWERAIVSVFLVPLLIFALVFSVFLITLVGSSVHR